MTQLKIEGVSGPLYVGEYNRHPYIGIQFMNKSPLHLYCNLPQPRSLLSSWTTMPNGSLLCSAHQQDIVKVVMPLTADLAI